MKIIFSEFFIVLTLSILLSGCGHHETYFRPVDNVISKPFYDKGITKLAILIKDGNDDEKRQIESGALEALIGHNYVISSRTDLKSLENEINFQQSSFSDSDSAKFGKIINVPAVLVFGFEKENKNNEYQLSARLIDVESGEVLYIARGDGSDLEKISFSLSFEIPPSTVYILKFRI